MAKFVSAEPFHPGEYIQDEITARNWTQDDFAEVSGISRRQVLNLIQGKSAITPESAQRIGEAFEQEPRTWIDLQISYEMALAAQGERGVARKAKLFAKVPVREIRKRGWITQSTNATDIESSVCTFLNIRNIDEQPQLCVWAIKNDKWEPPADLMLRKCRDDFARALREQYIEDDRGRPVRAKHVARFTKDNKQQYLWADIRTAKRGHIARAFQQRREQVVGACRQLDRDKDYYNKNHPKEKPIQVVFDFRDDIEEGNFSGEYPPKKPR
jgi:addiction module HigA family antidote